MKKSILLCIVLIFVITTMTVIVVEGAVRNCQYKPKVKNNFIPDRNCYGIINRTNDDATFQICVCKCRTAAKEIGSAGYYCGPKQPLGPGTIIDIKPPVPPPSVVVVSNVTTSTNSTVTVESNPLPEISTIPSVVEATENSKYFPSQYAKTKF